MPKEAAGEAPEQGPGGASLGQVRESCRQILYNKETAPELQDLPEVQFPLPALARPSGCAMLFDDEPVHRARCGAAVDRPARSSATAQEVPRPAEADEETVGRPMPSCVGTGHDGRHPRRHRRRWSSFFLGASMGSVVGEKVDARRPSGARAGERPLIVVSTWRRADAGGDPLAHADGEDLRRAARLREAADPATSPS